MRLHIIDVDVIIFLQRGFVKSQKGEKMRNKELREIIKQSGFKHWEIADALGVNEGTLCRMLRYELEEPARKKVLDAITKMRKGEK